MLEIPLIKEVKLPRLQLSKSNPRFPKPVNTEDEAILTFFRLKKVGPNKIISLMQDIIQTGYLLEDFIVLNKDNEYIVYDGNRRLTALKLLSKNTVEIIKDEFPFAYRKIISIKSTFDVSKIKILAKVYTDTESMANHVMKIHSGEQFGLGQITWASNEKNTFESEFFKKSYNFGNLIYKTLETQAEKEELYLQIKDKALTTTFDRIFAVSGIKTRIFALQKGANINLNNKLHLEKVCEMIEYFLSQNAVVEDVYRAQKTISFFNQIEPIVQINAITQGIIDISNHDYTQLELLDEDKKSNEESQTNQTSQLENSNKKGSSVTTVQVDSDSVPYELNFILTKQKLRMYRYNDFNLLDIVQLATDSNGENLINKVVFKSDKIIILDNQISGDTTVGDYQIQAKLEHNGKTASKSVMVSIILPTTKINTPQPNNELFKSVFSFAEGDVQININNTVDNLIREMQSIIHPENYKYMIASSTRQLIEISVNKLISEKNLKSHGNDTLKNFNEILNTIKSDNKLFGKLAQGDNKLHFQKIKNFINAIDTDSLINFLHLITHESGSAIYEELVEKINKQITPLLLVFHNYLHSD